MHTDYWYLTEGVFFYFGGLWPFFLQWARMHISLNMFTVVYSTFSFIITEVPLDSVNSFELLAFRIHKVNALASVWTCDIGISIKLLFLSLTSRVKFWL